MSDREREKAIPRLLKRLQGALDATESMIKNLEASLNNVLRSEEPSQSADEDRAKES